MEYISQIINITIESFDFGFCVAVNILTYLIIKLIDELNGSRKVATWTKRGVMLIAVIIISIAYYVTGKNKWGNIVPLFIVDVYTYGEANTKYDTTNNYNMYIFI